MGLKTFVDPSKFDNFVIDKFASPQECEALIRETQNKDHASLQDAIVGSDRRKDPKVRNNTTAFVKKRDDDPDSAEAKLRRRVDHLLQTHKNADTSMSEPLQVQIYKPGQHYSKHTDSWENASVCTGKANQRTWTCVLYLNDVTGGGTTTFPQIKSEGSGKGLVLHRPSDPTRAPEQGTLACWYNILPNFEANPLTEHQGDDVTRGEKYLANFWYQTKDKPQACDDPKWAKAQERAQATVTDVGENQIEANKWKGTVVIVAIAVAPFLLAILVIVLLVWWWRRRKRIQGQQQLQQHRSRV